jgi:hypothetical protein
LIQQDQLGSVSQPPIGTATTIGTVAPLAPGGPFDESAAIAFVQVDNSRYHYFVQVTANGVWNLPNMQVLGIVITYTMPTAGH